MFDSILFLPWHNFFANTLALYSMACFTYMTTILQMNFKIHSALYLIKWPVCFKVVCSEMVFCRLILNCIWDIVAFLSSRTMSAYTPQTFGIHKAVLSTQQPLTGYFFFFQTTHCKLRNPSRSAIFEELRPICLAPLWCLVWTAACHLHNVCMPNCPELWPCDWLFSFFVLASKQLNL